MYIQYIYIIKKHAHILLKKNETGPWLKHSIPGFKTPIGGTPGLKHDRPSNIRRRHGWFYTTMFGQPPDSYTHFW